MRGLDYVIDLERAKRLAVAFGLVFIALGVGALGLPRTHSAPMPVNVNLNAVHVAPHRILGGYEIATDGSYIYSCIQPTTTTRGTCDPVWRDGPGY